MTQEDPEAMQRATQSADDIFASLADPDLDDPKWPRCTRRCRTGSPDMTTRSRRWSGARTTAARARSAVPTSMPSLMPRLGSVTQTYTQLPDRSALGDELLAFGRASLVPDGAFGWLDRQGRITPGMPWLLYICCRMTHVYSLAEMQGRGGREMAEHGVRALTGIFRDREHGGWFSSVDESGRSTTRRRPIRTPSWCWPRPPR